MKIQAIAIAITLAGICGAAAAGNNTLQPVNVSDVTVQCTPPDDTAGSACDAFDRLVRANFTPREIGMLFGYSTSYPESRSGGIDRVQRRYQALMQGYIAGRAQPAAGTLASK